MLIKYLVYTSTSKEGELLSVVLENMESLLGIKTTLEQNQQESPTRSVPYKSQKIPASL